MKKSEKSKRQNQQRSVLVRPRLYLGDGVTIGPGKIDLLRAIGETHSISAAARAQGVPYKRAWLLIDSINRGFIHPVIETVTGGKGGGGTCLTQTGEALISTYDALEQRLNREADAEIDAIRKLAG